LHGAVHLAVQLGMLPSEFMARATSLDVGLLQDYYADQAERREKAAQEAEMLASADRNAVEAREKL